jgi:hypothetical protein
LQYVCDIERQQGAEIGKRKIGFLIRAERFTVKRSALIKKP